MPDPVRGPTDMIDGHVGGPCDMDIGEDPDGGGGDAECVPPCDAASRQADGDPVRDITAAAVVGDGRAAADGTRRLCEMVNEQGRAVADATALALRTRRMAQKQRRLHGSHGG
eukprot:COSAG01_NODE_1737_length_9362_cov_165.799309_1_plen_113_part_00